MSEQPRTFDTRELRRLGVPEAFLPTARYYAEKGAFPARPSPELLQRTIKLCLEALEEKAPLDLEEPAELIPAAAAAYARIRDSVREISTLGPLPAVCAVSAWSLIAKADPPLMIVENHNRITPAWWRAPELKPLSIACGMVNKLARDLSRPVSNCVVVFKPDVRDYSTADVDEMAVSHRQASGDIYWIALEGAGEFSTVEEVVVGDMRVLRGTEMPGSPKEAGEILTRSAIEDSAEAVRARLRIQEILNKAMPVKVGGHFAPGFKDCFADAAATRWAIERFISHR